jgi:phytoene synthase
MTAPPLTLASESGAKSSNLAFALGSLPAARRKDAMVFYAFCREIDDIADEPGRTPEEKHLLLDAWKDGLRGNQPIPEELQTIIIRHHLDRELLVQIVEGVEMDIEPRDFPTFNDLRNYCWHVASAVGLASIKLFGCTDPKSVRYAEDLGYALQITNILRDVGEDASLGRIYLPVEDTDRFGVDREQLRKGTATGRFRELMAFEAGRAREYYAGARQSLTAQDARALVPAETMREIYSRLLDRMEADDFRVMETRYRLSKLEKLAILLTKRIGFPW